MRQQDCVKKLHPEKARKNNMGRLKICSADPISSCPGFTTLKRKHWMITNRLRTRHAKTAYTITKLKSSPMCQRCSKAPETTSHCYKLPSYETRWWI
ncbi:hypothetical protein ElyMa_001416700 [Elysia marginata]|uniref:Uncharacterized protein n=1 Tax=Elysia marginata TaxID=1093978 RepID=A0AAV4IW10_9GAST|nr:hypothetical protein ElyMa_001416700 [Elysia marginata]